MRDISPSWVTVNLGAQSYGICVGSGVLSDSGSYANLPSAALAAIVTNPAVAALYSEKLQTRLASHYANVLLIELPEGEEHKNYGTMEKIFDRLLRANADRSTTLFALGGGVIGDITGFAAACFMRGVPYVQVPTTLLAQVDSSVGGKTAVNHPLGKNMIGAFYQPRRVIVDLDTLNSLPKRELVAGLAEIIKYGPVSDQGFLEWIERNLDALLSRDEATLAYAVTRACEIKASIVEEDEHEAGRRAILNFGHTFGHAIETGLGFGAWLHGEAVGCGMVMAAELSARLGMIDRAYALRLRTLIERAGLPVRGPRLGEDRYLELMGHDKKAEAGELRFVLLEDLGRAGVHGAAQEMVRDVLNECTG